MANFCPTPEISPPFLNGGQRVILLLRLFCRSFMALDRVSRLIYKQFIINGCRKIDTQIVRKKKEVYRNIRYFFRRLARRG